MTRRGVMCSTAALSGAGAMLAVIGCGGDHRPAGRPPAAACRNAVTDTLGLVARRIYHEVATGANAGDATNRVQHSVALMDAAARGDANATRAALVGLLNRQIVRIRVTRGARVLAKVGRAPALGPVRGTLRDPQGRAVATYVLSVGSDTSFAALTAGLTGAHVLLRSGRHPIRIRGPLEPGPPSVPDRGPVRYRGHAYQAVSFSATAFPAGHLRASLLIPSRLADRCVGGSAQTVADTIGRVGRRIYDEERAGPHVSSTLRHVERFAPFRRAVARADPLATRAAIVSLFGSHIHMVRIRASRGPALVADVGGPAVLAPVQGTLLGARGRPYGHFLLAVQDDAGYVKLVRRFTGAQVLLRSGAHQVIGTLSPGPASVPDRGRVAYRGRDYEAYSFAAEAFPSGPLRISILVAQPPA